MSLPVPVPLGHCRNYWADSLRSLEEGNKARGLPLVINDLTCNRYDHIAFQAMYDLDVPRPLHKTVFHLVRPAVSLRKNSMVEDAEGRFGVRCINAEKKDVLCAIVRAATDVARSRHTDGSGETRNGLIDVGDRATGDRAAGDRATGARATGDNATNPFRRTIDGNSTNAFGAMDRQSTNAFRRTIDGNPSNTFGAMDGQSTNAFGAMCRNSTNALDSNSVMCRNSTNALGSSPVAFGKPMDRRPTNAFGDATNRNLTNALMATDRRPTNTLMATDRRPTNTLDDTPSKQPARPGFFSINSGKSLPLAGLPAELPADAGQACPPEDPLLALGDKVKSLSIEAVRKGRMPKGWAATCVEAGKATRKAATAKADLDTSHQRRMVEAVESISRSLRILARAAIMLDDGDDGWGEDEEAF